MPSLLRPLAVALTAAGLTLALTGPAAATGRDPLAGSTVTGRLVQAWPESADDREVAAAPLSWVQPARGSAVRLDTADLADVPTGATVRVTVGGTVADAAGADGYDPAHAVVTASVLATGTADTITTADTTDTTTAGDTPGSGTTGSSESATASTTAADPAPGVTDRVTVVLVLPPGAAPDGTTTEQLTSAVDGPVTRFWEQQTRGAVRFGVDVTHDWVRTAAGCDDPTALWNEAAAAAGFTAGPGRHLLVYVSTRPGSLAGCSYGLAQVGTGLHGGGALYVRDTLPSLIAHELGHNLGLGHSSGRQCDGAVDRADLADPGCRDQPYRDYYDVMAASWEQMGTLNAAQEALLGVLPAGEQRTLDAAGPGGTVTLAPLGGTGGVRGLQLTAGGTGYWLEYRAATGQDAWLGTAADRLGLQAGVLVHRTGPLPDTSLLLDGTPSPRAGWDDDLQDALPVGGAVQLPGGFTVTVRSTGAGGATVAVATTPAAAAAVPAPRPRPTGTTLPARPHASTPADTAAPAPASEAALVPVPAVPARAADTRTLPAALASSADPGLLAVGCGLAAALVLLGATVAARRARARRTPR